MQIIDVAVWDLGKHANIDLVPNHLVKVRIPVFYTTEKSYFSFFRNYIDEFLLFHHREDTCTEFFVCMMGNRIDFSCDPGEIFDVSRRRCFPGDDILCELH
jgi:Chitin binding Peritrophin-A domain